MIINNDLICPHDILLDAKEVGSILHISKDALAKSRWLKKKKGEPQPFKTVYIGGRIYYSSNSIKSFIQNQLEA